MVEAGVSEYDRVTSHRLQGVYFDRMTKDGQRDKAGMFGIPYAFFPEKMS